jgi:hypothetical protein
MREHLRNIEGQRAAFSATFKEFATHSSGGYVIERALFIDVKNEQNVEVCDHIWMRKGKQVIALDLQPGDRVKFTATSKGYWSGYHDNRHYNFGLKWPRKVAKTGEAKTVEGLPLFELTK